MRDHVFFRENGGGGGGQPFITKYKEKYYRKLMADERRGGIWNTTKP